MNSVWIWGHTHRATTRILIFDVGNKYLGNYPLTLIADLPSFIENNSLVFQNKPDNGNCNPNLTTSVSFSNGIFKQNVVITRETFTPWIRNSFNQFRGLSSEKTPFLNQKHLLYLYNKFIDCYLYH